MQRLNEKTLVFWTFSNRHFGYERTNDRHSTRRKVLVSKVCSKANEASGAQYQTNYYTTIYGVVGRQGIPSSWGGVTFSHGRFRCLILQQSLGLWKHMFD